MDLDAQKMEKLMSEYDFDYFVIGAGSGGIRSARIAASHGAKVGVAEYKVIGGTCVNVGCVPKKIMAYAADYHAEFEDAKGYGWEIGDKKSFDWKKFIERKNAEIERLNGIYNGLLEKNNVNYFEGQASLVDRNTVKIGEQTITAEKILIATGGTPRPMTIPGGEYAITSDEVFYLHKQPEHIVLIGGGYIAVEFAHIFAGLGTKVTLCYRKSQFLRGFDHDISQKLAEEMIKQGITLNFNCDIEKIEKDSGTLKAYTNDGKIIECDQILSAIGRIPNTEGLNLESVGIATSENGQIKINEHYQTSIDNIYALGDVANQHHLTPVATAEGQALANNLFSPQKDHKVHYQNITTAIFSRPAIATVGYDDVQAREKGFDVEVFTASFRSMKFILAERDEKNFMKLVVDKQTDRVIGCHMIGLDSPEIMQGFAVALNAGATKADFDKTIGIHPTSAEEFVTMK